MTKHMLPWQEGHEGRAGVHGAGDLQWISGGVNGRVKDE